MAEAGIKHTAGFAKVRRGLRGLTEEHAQRVRDVVQVSMMSSIDGCCEEWPNQA
jgi:hypothetical protein